MEIALEELRDCVSGEVSAEEKAIRREILACLNNFLETLNDVERNIFPGKRFWNIMGIVWRSFPKKNEKRK